MSKKKAVTIVVILALVGLTAVFPIKRAIETERSKAAAYEQGLACLESGEWSQAYQTLGSYELWDYKDARSLSQYCDAKLSFESGDTYSAQIKLTGIGVTASHQEDIAQLRRQIEDDMPAYQERERQKAEQKKQEEMSAARRGVPYVGMPEHWVDITTWGKPGKERWNSYMENGQPKRANLYDFYQNGRLRFTVRCTHGQVESITDWGDSFGALTKAPGSAGNGNNIPSTAKTTVSDPYNAKDYSNPDDFYYDHYDDFIDYEGAEDYFYEHCS